MNEKQKTSINKSEKEQQLRRLAHEIQTPLSVIAMGLDVIKGTQSDNEDLVQITKMMQEDGVVPLKEMVAHFIEVACRVGNENDEPL